MPTTTEPTLKPRKPWKYGKRGVALLVLLQEILDLAEAMKAKAREASSLDYETFLAITRHADRPGGDEWEAREYMRCLDAVPFVLNGITPTIDSFLPHFAVPKG